MNQDTALREAREWAEKYWAAKAETDRLRDALRKVVRTADELHLARLGDGHPGTKHDDILHGSGRRRVVDDCARCAAAECEAEDERDLAIARARVLLGVPRQPWEEDWLYAEEVKP
jgi:hypothetical protein